MQKIIFSLVIPLIAMGLCAFPQIALGSSAPIPIGGLESPETGYSLGSNLLTNGDLKSGVQGWTLDASCFSLDNADGNPSLRLTEPCSHNSPFAQNATSIPSGDYTISADIKTKISFTIPRGRGGARVRLVLTSGKGWAPTKPVNADDWTTATKAHAVVADGNSAWFRAEAVGPVTGVSWFKNFSVRREHPPLLQTFLLYPNYRGLMFSDQSQVARLAIDITPPEGITLKQLSVLIELMDKSGKVLSSHTYPPPSEGSLVAEVNLGELPMGEYRIQGTLVGPQNKHLFTQSPYTVVKVSSDSRATMKAWVDPDNIIHMGGRPRFVIGLYDTTGFSTRSDFFTPRLSAIAKAPINLMINYFMAHGKADLIPPYTEAMEPFGIYYLATVNNLFPEMKKGYPKWAQEQGLGPDQVVSQYSKDLSADPRVMGYYTCDECASELQPRTFHQYNVIKENDPASITFAVENYPNEFQYWRDSVDVLGVDPYPIGSPNLLSFVGDQTRKVIAAVHGARPVWTVIQFFRVTMLSHFPTEQELHDMSWMAIAEGARGVFYWSYGLRGLDWGKRDPVLRQQRYDEVVQVTKEISALEPVLLAPDSPVLSANSAAGTVITKEKDLKDGSRYLISYNHSGDSIDASFTLRRPAKSVSVEGENRNLPADHNGLGFKDSYAPFQAHVYKIEG